MNKVIAIVGGGAAGMMAAAALIESNIKADIHIFDANTKLGVKVMISGGGRCNVTTGITQQHILRKQYTRGANFLKAALSKFSPKHCYNWFEKHGVPLKTESDNRVFPKSNNGTDVVHIFEKLFKNHATIHFKTRIQTITKSNNRFTLTTPKETLTFDFIILATGGNAYRKTGSQGDGYHFAEALGHTITPLGPSLNSLLTKEQWPKKLSGIALSSATLTHNKTSVTGPFLFTHFGISGPVTFALSSHLAFENLPCSITLNPDTQNWKKILTNKSDAKKQIKTILSNQFPSRFAEQLCILTDIKPDTKLADIQTNNRKHLIDLLINGLPLTLTKRRPGDEFVTAGGVNTDEINSQNMESKITPNLYFTGELMNIDAVTGGFNLQSSWATGHLAGYSIAKKIKKTHL